MKIEDWCDQDGFVHLHKFPKADESENGPLFTAHINLYKYTNPMLMTLFRNPASPQSSNLRANRFSGSDHFSHDNMTGLYSLCITGQYYLLLDKLPIYKWNNRWWLHPRDIAFYNLARRKLCLLSPLFVFILFLVSLHSFAQEKGRTSGKLLWHVRLRTLRKVYTSRIAQTMYALWERIGLSLAGQTWESISRIYFKDNDHPLHEMIGRE